MGGNAAKAEGVAVHRARTWSRRVLRKTPSCMEDGWTGASLGRPRESQASQGPRRADGDSTRRVLCNSGSPHEPRGPLLSRARPWKRVAEADAGAIQRLLPILEGGEERSAIRAL